MRRAIVVENVISVLLALLLPCLMLSAAACGSAAPPAGYEAVSTAVETVARADLAAGTPAQTVGLRMAEAVGRGLLRLGLAIAGAAGGGERAGAPTPQALAASMRAGGGTSPAVEGETPIGYTPPQPGPLDQRVAVQRIMEAQRRLGLTHTPQQLQASEAPLPARAGRPEVSACPIGGIGTIDKRPTSLPSVDGR